MKSFFLKNKVFIMGMLAAISVVIQQFAGNPAVDWKVIGYAVLMALLSYVANQWRGKNLTITGIVGTLASVFVSSYTPGAKMNWQQFILLAIAAILSTAIPAPKPAEEIKPPIV